MGMIFFAVPIVKKKKKVGVDFFLLFINRPMENFQTVLNVLAIAVYENQLPFTIVRFVRW